MTNSYAFFILVSYWFICFYGCCNFGGLYWRNFYLDATRLFCIVFAANKFFKYSAKDLPSNFCFMVSYWVGHLCRFVDDFFRLTSRSSSYLFDLFLDLDLLPLTPVLFKFVIYTDYYLPNALSDVVLMIKLQSKAKFAWFVLNAESALLEHWILEH